ncbi:MAG TPA: HEAT repeat domain-containing protein, partial [Kofleriaceae bacterium]|nr:HEAT repeat domain-containing protein [Kofleriaceae bacterium]
ICQKVCPFNAKAPQRTPPAPELSPRPELAGGLDLFALARLSASGYRKLVRHSSLRRASRPMLARNACVALGNTADPRAVEVLAAAATDKSALVRGHAAWALGRHGQVSILERLLETETDPYVRDEITAATAAPGGLARGGQA